MASSKDIASAMNLQLNNIGKRYNYQWIFRGLNLDVKNSEVVAIKGSNGSGKTTLMSILSGYQAPSEGNIEWLDEQEKIISPDKIFKHITWCSPATELPEEFTLNEMIEFQAKFKPWLFGISTSKIIEITQLQSQAHQPISSFSTGMKQRLKVALAILADVKMVLLDEPTSNLDEWGIEWYKKLIQQYSSNRIIIIASNMQHDFINVDKEINMIDFKIIKN
ncbi:MAG: Energy-coupling factor transporter ATP-binding protein EcfA1 [Bacteroidota bacterium]